MAGKLSSDEDKKTLRGLLQTQKKVTHHKSKACEMCLIEHGLTDIWAIPGGPQLCPYHWTKRVWWEEWARKCLEKQAKEGNPIEKQLLNEYLERKSN
jgi:hypothetical protein